MTYDQWKTTDPADFYAPICERCGGYLRGFGRDECEACADEFLADEAFMRFYEWEPEGPRGTMTAPQQSRSAPSRCEEHKDPDRRGK